MKHLLRNILEQNGNVLGLLLRIQEILLISFGPLWLGFVAALGTTLWPL